jgi:hypothetical protein
MQGIPVKRLRVDSVDLALPARMEVQIACSPAVGPALVQKDIAGYLFNSN